MNEDVEKLKLEIKELKRVNKVKQELYEEQKKACEKLNKELDSACEKIAMDNVGHCPSDDYGYEPPFCDFENGECSHCASECYRCYIEKVVEEETNG